MRPKKTFASPKKGQSNTKKVAERLNVTPRRVRQMRAEGFPVEDGADAVIMAMESAGKRGYDTPALEKARLGVLRETERKYKIANDAKQRMVVDRAEVEGALQKIIPRFFDRIETTFAYE